MLAAYQLMNPESTAVVPGQLITSVWLPTWPARLTVAMTVAT